MLPISEVEKSPFRLTDGLLPHHGDLTWYVTRSATRQETRAERSLINAKVAFYVPCLTTWRGHPGPNRRKVRRSLFEGYFFAGLASGQSFYDLKDLEAVHGVVRFGSGVQPQPANFGLISLILAAEGAGHFDRTIQVIELAAFKAREPVRVVEGNFRGFNASFVRMQPKDRVRVLLDIFGRPTEIELPITDIRKLA